MPLLALVFLAFLAIGYKLYGRFVAAKFGLNDSSLTPAVTKNDGVDYCPTSRFYLFGQHFSAIAAAGPIVGPIVASQQFGWLPCVLWIGLGAVFIGAVHDFSTLIASVRHQGRSIAEIVRKRLGSRAWYAMMLFIWIALIYVIIAFADVTANTFVGTISDVKPGSVDFNVGGAVAAASISYLLLAIVMGLIQKKWNPPIWILTVIFVPATLFLVWFGTKISTVLMLSPLTWGMLILAYCFVASLLPMWLLLQPRGYLGGFILYLALAAGIIGLFFGNFPLRQEAFITWNSKTMGSLFPFLFVTVACGACSGFHGLVASGTTSKQISKESHCRPVGYGAMLLEGFVALIALSTVMIAVPDTLKGMAPGRIYGQGIGHFLSVVLGEKNFYLAATFGAMAFSTFVFDTLDVATRLGRYILQELFDLQGRRGALVATALTIVPPASMLLLAKAGSYQIFWVLFGTSNQLLAALSLLAITIWLKQSGRSYSFALIPMLFVMTITLWSLVIQARSAFSTLVSGGMKTATLMNGVVALFLILLAVLMIFESLRNYARSEEMKPSPLA